MSSNASTSNNLQELKQRALQRKNNGAREKGAAVARNIENKSKKARAGRARADAPNARDRTSLNARGSRFGREKNIRSGNAGENKNEGEEENDDDENSSGSSDSDASSTGEDNLGPNGRHKSRREIRENMVVPPMSLKFWQVHGDLDTDVGGHLTFPTQSSRLSKDELTKKKIQNLNKDASGPGSGFSANKTPQIAVPSNVTSTTIGRVRRRLGQELSTKQTPASATASKNNTYPQKNPKNKETIKSNLSDDWFSPSGHVKTLPDPIDSGRVIPSALATTGGAVDIVKPEEFRTTHHQGHMGGSALMRGSKGRRSQVVIKFGKVRFSDHKSFKEEDIIAHQLTNAHTEYFKIIASDTEAHHLSRVLACGAILESKSEEVRQYNLLEQKQGAELLNLAMDMYQAWAAYINTFRTVRALEKKVYETWRNLKHHREKETISCTSLDLEVRQMDSTISSKSGWDKLSKNMRLLEDVLDLLEPKLLEKAPSMTGSGKSMRARAAEKFADFEKNDMALRLNKRTIPIFLLSDKHAITPTSTLLSNPKLYNDEIRRRQTAVRCQYYGRLMINGHQVGKTRLASVRWPEFELDFGSTMRIEIVRRPENVVLDIYKKGKIKDTYISSIQIGLQGPTDTRSSATTTAPVFSHYSFSAATSDIPYSLELQTAQRRLKEEDDDDEDDDATKTFLLPKNGRYTSGRIEITTTWLGWLTQAAEHEGSELWAPLPPQRREHERAKLIGGEVGITGELAGKHSLNNSSKSRSSRSSKHNQGHGLHLLNAVGNSRLDPNDPNNVEMIDLIRHHGQVSNVSLLQGSEPYRVESLPGNSSATFHSRDASKFRVPERQILLQLRYAMPHLFHNGKPLPLIDDEILQDPHWRIMLTPKNKARLLGGRAMEEDDEEQEPDYFGFDSAFLMKRQNKMKSFVEKVRLAQLELQSTGRSYGVLSRWVREGIMPDFQLDLSFIMDKLAPKRKLKPKAKARKEAPMVKDVYVIVQVASAFNIPQRRFALGDKGGGGGGTGAPPGSPVRGARRGGTRQGSPDRRSGGGGNGGATNDFDEDEYSDDEENQGGSRTCNTFVEGSFQGQHPRTSPRTGTQPMWNETLRMRFIPAYSGTQSRWTASNMKQVRDKVRISVFDEQVHQNEKDFRQKNSVNERRERRYLGTVSVPFTTLYRQKTVQGLFRLERPTINLAYENPVAAEDDGNPDNLIIPGSERALKIASAEATYINMMLTLDPPLQTIPGDNGGIDHASIKSSESPAILKRARYFSKMKDPKRGPIKIIVPTLSGERILVTRFLTPQKPPPEISSITEAARYVSLIPFMEDWQLFVGNEDIWSYSNQFLELCAGDWEEHAVLLRNYFAFLDGNRFDNYLVFGHGLPEGDTVYVMRRPSDEVESDVTFFNASSGIEYARTDTRCSLQSISSVVTEDNVYINIQATASPARMKYDFSNLKQWKPFFDKKMPIPFDYSPSQPEIKYTPTPAKDIDGLERQILETLRVDLKEWRSKSYQTYLNTTVAREMQKTLQGLEDHKMGKGDFSEYGHLDALKKWTSTFDFTGYPLNFTFTDVKAISYALKDTNIHTNEDPDVKFALTVKCFGYSNGIISVWVYAAALVRR